MVQNKCKCSAEAWSKKLLSSIKSSSEVPYFDKTRGPSLSVLKSKLMPTTGHGSVTVYETFVSCATYQLPTTSHLPLPPDNWLQARDCAQPLLCADTRQSVKRQWDLLSDGGSEDESFLDASRFSVVYKWAGRPDESHKSDRHRHKKLKRDMTVF